MEMPIKKSKKQGVKNLQLSDCKARRQWLKGLAVSTLGLGTTLINVPSIAQTSLLAGAASSLISVQPNASVNQLGIGKPQHALILPPSIGIYAQVHQALRAGFTAAHQRDGSNWPISMIESDDKPTDLFNTYVELQKAGTLLVIGPVTRNGVNALIDSGAPNILTLALNQPDADRNLPRNLIVFGLAVETEAAQIAAWAFDEASTREPARRPLRATAVAHSSPLGRRAAAAFIDKWRELGGDCPLPIETENRTATEIKNAIAPNEPDAVFLGASLENARTIRAALDRKWPVYGTSQLSSAGSGTFNKGSELDGVKFVDMPWMVQADHPAVMTYPKVPARFTNEMQRLYALGIDAFRLAMETLSDNNRTELDGVTGRLQLNRSLNRVERAGVLLQYQNGQIVSN